MSDTLSLEELEYQRGLEDGRREARLLVMSKVTTQVANVLKHYHRWAQGSDLECDPKDVVDGIIDSLVEYTDLDIMMLAKSVLPAPPTGWANYPHPFEQKQWLYRWGRDEKNRVRYDWS